MTAPPRNAIRRAFPDDVLAAFAVLTFALTVALMPITIASMEKKVPATNPSAICHPRRMNKAIPITMTKYKTVLISLFKKVFAPS